MNESSQDDVGVGNLFAQNDEEAKHRFSIYKSKDPFPEIPPALLNSADIFDYVAKTGMIYPFNPSETKLKSASYEIDLFGEIHFWDDKKKKQVIKLEKGKRFPLEKNSIAFVSLETIFRLPDYIALRFNFRIKHVHRGLLLGTGPLVDPGFEGKLLIPLHNLTADDYEIEAGEGLIWVEFTKLSPNEKWNQEDVDSTRHGKYIPFPEGGKYRPPEQYFARSTQGNAIRSSIPETFLDVQRSAKEAEKSAKESKTASLDSLEAVQRTTRMFYGIGVVAIVGLILALYSSFHQVVSLVQDTSSYLHSARGEFETFKHTLNQRNIEFQAGALDKLNSLEKEVQDLKMKIENLTKSPKKQSVAPQFTLGSPNSQDAIPDR